jgi:hypothetical protein
MARRPKRRAPRLSIPTWRSRSAAAWWLDQVSLRLRREVSWARHQRGECTSADSTRSAARRRGAGEPGSHAVSRGEARVLQRRRHRSLSLRAHRGVRSAAAHGVRERFWPRVRSPGPGPGSAVHPGAGACHAAGRRAGSGLRRVPERCRAAVRDAGAGAAALGRSARRGRLRRSVARAVPLRPGEPAACARPRLAPAAGDGEPGGARFARSGASAAGADVRVSRRIPHGGARRDRTPRRQPAAAAAAGSADRSARRRFRRVGAAVRAAHGRGLAELRPTLPPNAASCSRPPPPSAARQDGCCRKTGPSAARVTRSRGTPRPRRCRCAGICRCKIRRS